MAGGGADLNDTSAGAVADSESDTENWSPVSNAAGRGSISGGSGGSVSRSRSTRRSGGGGGSCSPMPLFAAGSGLFFISLFNFRIVNMSFKIKLLRTISKC